MHKIISEDTKRRLLNRRFLWIKLKDDAFGRRSYDSFQHRSALFIKFLKKISSTSKDPFELKCSFLVLSKRNYSCELLRPYRRLWIFFVFFQKFFQKFRHFLSLRRVILRKEITVHCNHLLSQRERRCE